MASGDEIVVNNPSRVLITEFEAYVRLSDDPQDLVGQKVRMVSIPNINVVEPITLGPPRFRRRRK